MGFEIIHKAIDKAAFKAESVSFDISNDKWILFSDHHRGRKDGADDFLICEPAYKIAIEHYFENGFTMAMLGDVEEFWENPIYSVLLKYKDLMLLEKKFFDKNRLYRIWGNHDDQWQFGRFLTKHLDFLFPNIEVHEALQIQFKKDQNLIGSSLLIHGHQGNLESDRFAWLSKFFVRYGWRNIQRLFNIALSTPSNDLTLRSSHDRAMYEWAKTKDKQLIICGHTHQAVFESKTKLDRLQDELKKLGSTISKAESEQDIDSIEQEIKKLKEKYTSIDEFSKESPRYFNTGCCSYSDGDITGIELDKNKIRLIKWSGGIYSKKTTLQEASLLELF